MIFPKWLILEILTGTVTHIVSREEPKQLGYNIQTNKKYGEFRVLESTERTMASFTNEEAISYGYLGKGAMLNQIQRTEDLSLNDTKTPVYLWKIEVKKITEEGQKLLQPKILKTIKTRKRPQRKEVIAYWKGKCPQCSQDYMKLKTHWKRGGKYYVCESCGYKENEPKRLTSKNAKVFNEKGEQVGMQFCDVCGSRVYPRKKPEGKGFYYYCPKCKKKASDIPKEYKVFYQ